ncbi:uncharacterized protein LOC62_03G004353 [Vanrija pseudolonga]|uniref:Uncharacterized protein n=1 Tax=Vanrija pseudolonga TaxID=143232 RepID=A0AAF0Y632_9TREE|nr:hypothetical protein LOC62_03G004353 [Vanrija pseudolonga]
MSELSTTSVSMVTAPSDASTVPDLAALARDLARSRRRQRAHVADILASRHNQEVTLEAILRLEKVKEESFNALRQAQAEHHVQLRAFIDSIEATYGRTPGSGGPVPPPTTPAPLDATAPPAPPGFPTPPPRRATESLLGLGVDDENAGLEIAQSESDSSTETGGVEPGELMADHTVPPSDSTPFSNVAQVGRHRPYFVLNPSPESTPRPPAPSLPRSPLELSPAPTITVARPTRVVLDDTDGLTDNTYATATEPGYHVDTRTTRHHRHAPGANTSAQPQPQVPYCCDWNWYDVCYRGTFCPRGAWHACWNCHPAGEPAQHQARDCRKVLAPGSFRWVE